MRGTNNLYDIAEQQGILVLPCRMGQLEALSLIDEKGRCSIGIDPKKLKNTVDEREKLAHELGHCLTGAFYNRHSPLDIPSKHEARACRRAAELLIPEDELMEALREKRSIYELAEQFSVELETVRLALRCRREQLPPCADESFG